MASTHYPTKVVAGCQEALPTTPLALPRAKGSYGQILKSSAVVGGSSLLNVGIGIIRTKAMALLLGPAGFGLFGMYGSVASLSQTIAGMGVNSSGVRQIAEAVGSGDNQRTANTVAVLRRISIVLGSLGAGLLAIFSGQVSVLTFGSDKHSTAVRLLSLAVLFQLVSNGQAALIQGMRRILDLAKIAVLGALFGTLISIPLVYFFHERGIAPSLVCVAGVTVITSWWYSRKINIRTPVMATSDVRREAMGLLKLGFAFMSSALTMMGVAYVVRVTILHKLSFAATGYYQSAWTLGGLYVGFILQAMGADFYPRLTATANDHAVCNRLVNEQTQVGLLLAGPGVIATLTFAPAIIALLYSSEFGAAVGILRWVCLGATLQVITWPMGFIIVAKSRSGLLVFTELAWAVVHIGLAWICIARFGLNGAGIAFFGSYVFHAFLIYPIVSRLSGFRWSRANKYTGVLFLSLIAIIFCSLYVLPFIWAACLGSLATVLSGAYSLRVVSKLVPMDEIPRQIRWLFTWAGLEDIRSTVPVAIAAPTAGTAESKS